MSVFLFALKRLKNALPQVAKNQCCPEVGKKQHSAHVQKKKICHKWQKKSKKLVLGVAKSQKLCYYIVKQEILNC